MWHTFVTMTTDQLIGERVHQIMFRRRVKQTQLCQRMGISQSTLSNKLHGKRPWTSDEVYLAAYLLKVPVGDILPPINEVLPHLDSNQKPFGKRSDADAPPDESAA